MMSKRKWEIRTVTGIKKTEGTRVLIAGYLDCIVHDNKRKYGWCRDRYTVTELSTGFRVGSGGSEKEAIIDAEKRAKRAGKRRAYERLRQIYDKCGELNVGVW